MTLIPQADAGCVLALVLASAITLGMAPDAAARPLELIKTRGVIELCAAPNALPFAS